MVELRICIDVEDLPKAIDFYTRAFGLTVGRRYGNVFAELLGASAPMDLLAKHAGTAPGPAAGVVRDYRRHWTPVHLDVVVQALDTAVACALGCGATLDGPVQEKAWGRMASLADPFGNGFCLLEFKGKGYDALLSPSS
jgi:catechol 2,3-dioxygenase-like lactoylglutathione lyase family enzyme